MMMTSIGYSATAPGTSGAVAAAVSGDSLTILNARASSRVWICSLLTMNQGAGWHQVIYPSAHDTTRGFRTVCPIGVGSSRIPMGWPLRPQPQEVLSLTIAGSATAGDIENGAMLLWYEDYPGITANLKTPEEVWARAIRQTTIESTLALGTGGGWTGSELITAESDLLHANTDYAVLGCSNTIDCCAVGLKAPDWGNQRIILPGGKSLQTQSQNWFVDLSENFGVPMIPVFNSANKGNIYLDGLQDENGVDQNVSLYLVELATDGAPGGVPTQFAING